MMKPLKIVSTPMLLTFVVVLCGCGGSTAPLTYTQLQQALSGNEPLHRTGLPAGTKGGRSWTESGAARMDLLYTSNVYNVTVYSYPAGKHVGTLKGFLEPHGECADATGDVFIADGDTVLEYKHAGIKPIKKLTMSGFLSGACATDPTSGNLAVTWASGSYNSYVAIYRHASGAPTLYNNGNMALTFCGYDDKGNLFVDGYFPSQHHAFAFAELAAGSSNIKSIALDQSIENDGAVQWDGKYITVEDNTANKIYRFAISGSSGTLKGTVDLGNAQGLYETWIDGTTVVGADDLASTVWYWKYPAGGAAFKSITKHVFHPFGVAISKATH